MKKFSDLNKEELERLKLASEVRDKNRPFVLRHFASIVILILTGASLFTGFYTTLFDAKRENLELDIRKFQNEKKSLKVSLDTLKSQVKDYTTLINSLTSQRGLAQEQEKKTKEQLKILEDERQRQIQEFERIKGQNLADKEKTKKLTDLAWSYEKTAERNINKINTLTTDLYTQSMVNSRLTKIIENSVGKISVLNNTDSYNFDAIIGKVVDENDIPIENAKILFKKSLHGPHTKNSDANGSFSIKFKRDYQNQGRTFPVSISKEGYKTIEGYIVVGSTVKVKLKKGT